MKLATLKTDKLDGQLVLVSRNLEQMVTVPEIAPSLQHALDYWHELSPKLDTIYQKLNAKQLTNALPYDAKKLHSPLPRAYQWADGSAYLNHVQLVRKARGAQMPESFLTDPLMYQGGSDAFLGPRDDIPVTSETYGIDFETEVAVITDKVAMASNTETCQTKILLLMLVNDVTLRELIPEELAKGFGFFHGKPASSFSPLAITPDELGDAWDGQKLHLPVYTYLNQQLFGKPNAGIGMQFSFPELIAHAAKTRNLAAGTIIGSGTISNDEPGVGCSCIVEKRVIEIIKDGKPSTSYMKFGDEVKIEMLDKNGHNLFGCIEQKVVPYHTQG
jgi:fumarylacetoacetate (FAA) hydrolase